MMPKHKTRNTFYKKIWLVYVILQKKKKKKNFYQKSLQKLRPEK